MASGNGNGNGKEEKPKGTPWWYWILWILWWILWILTAGILFGGIVYAVNVRWYLDGQVDALFPEYVAGIGLWFWLGFAVWVAEVIIATLIMGWGDEPKRLKRIAKVVGKPAIWITVYVALLFAVGFLTTPLEGGIYVLPKELVLAVPALLYLVLAIIRFWRFRTESGGGGGDGKGGDEEEEELLPTGKALRRRIKAIFGGDGIYTTAEKIATGMLRVLDALCTPDEGQKAEDVPPRPTMEEAAMACYEALDGAKGDGAVTLDEWKGAREKTKAFTKVAPPKEEEEEEGGEEG